MSGCGGEGEVTGEGGEDGGEGGEGGGVCCGEAGGEAGGVGGGEMRDERLMIWLDAAAAVGNGLVGGVSNRAVHWWTVCTPNCMTVAMREDGG